MSAGHPQRHDTPISSTSQTAGKGPAILQIVPTLDTGGAERTTVDIAAALARENFVAVVATRRGRMIDELRHVGGLWVKLPVDSRLPHTILANVFRLRRLIAKGNIKLVHARSRAPAWSALLAARMARVPFVTTYHGIYNAQSEMKRFYNSVMARGDTVIANSQWTANHIRAEYRFAPKHLTVIPRGVDFLRFDQANISQERVAKIRARWGVQREDVVVMLPGRLTRWKGQTVFIRALGELKREGTLGNLRAILAGDPQGRTGYESELQKLSESFELGSSLVVAGHVADMPAAYLVADIVVSASTEPEAFGRVAAEAGAMARPVIATDHGGSREIILPNKSGILVAPDQPSELAAALRSLIEAGPEVRRDMGAAARTHVAANFTVERMCSDTIALYRELLANRL